MHISPRETAHVLILNPSEDLLGALHSLIDSQQVKRCFGVANFGDHERNGHLHAVAIHLPVWGFIQMFDEVKQGGHSGSSTG